MHVTFDTEQHIGRRREQQDAVRARTGLPGFPEGALLAVVCDGMGGLQGGAEASYLAADTFLAAFGRTAHAEPVAEVLRRALAEAGRAVYTAARARGVEGDMGTTLVAAVVEGERLHWISVGDSRLYLVRGGQAHQLNTEHNLATRLVEAVRSGKLSAEEAAAHPQRHALTSFLGTARLDEIDGATEPLLLHPGDRVLLCSDGLHGTLSDAELVGLLATAPQSREAHELVQAALTRERPNQDNVSAVVLTAVTRNADAQAEPALTQVRPPMAPLPAPKPADAGWKPLALLGVLLLAAGAAFLSLRTGPLAPVPALDSTRTMPVDSLRPDSARADSLRRDSLRADSLARRDTTRLRPDALRPDTLPASADSAQRLRLSAR